MEKFTHLLFISLIAGGFFLAPQALSSSNFEKNNRPTRAQKIAGDPTAPNIPSLGAQIRAARLKKKMLAATLASSTGLTVENMTNIENDRAVPTRNILIEIQQLLDCELIFDGKVGNQKGFR